MAKARPNPKQKSTNFWQKFRSQSNSVQLVMFLVLFALIGGGIAVYKSFAYTKVLTYQENSTGIVRHYGYIGSDQNRSVWVTNTLAPGQWVWYGPYRGFDNRTGQWYFMEADFLIRDFNQAFGKPASTILVQIVHNENDGRGVQVIKNASHQYTLNSSFKSSYGNAWVLASQLDHTYYHNVEFRVKLISGWVAIDRVDFSYGDGTDIPPFP